MSNSTKFTIALSLFLWASAFVAIREGLTGYSPEGLALLRFSVASLCMGILYLFLPKRTRVKTKDIALMMLCGMIGVGIYNVTLNHSEITLNSGMASFITSQSPIITALFAVFFLGEKINVAGILGFTVSILGIGFIALGEMGGFNWDTSLTYIIIATFASGFYTISQKPFVDKYHSIEVTAFYIWGGTLFLSMYYPLLRDDFTHTSLYATLTAIYLGIFPAAIGLLAWSFVLRKIPASRAGSFLYFMPFLATLLGWLYLGEIPVFMSIFGGLLAIVGVWLVNHSYGLSATDLEPIADAERAEH